MRWLGRFYHQIEMDDRITPRTGLIIEKGGERIVAIHIVVSRNGRTPQLFYIDFKRGVALTKPMYWLRLCYRAPAWWNILDGGDYPRWWRRLECCWGVDPLPGYRATGKRAELFE
jgi:hypothetical protein